VTLTDAFGRPWPEDTHPANCVGVGWTHIINHLINDLEKLGWDGHVYQVKEKFGGLRFYIGAATDEIHDRIQEAENESFTVCERCGAPGYPKDEGWILTLCDPCREKE
jgi:hypothetical protein